MMANFKQVLLNAMEHEKFSVVSVNQNIMQASLATKRNTGYLKVAVNDELARGIMMRKQTAFIFYIDGDELNEIAESLDKDSPESE